MTAKSSPRGQMLWQQLSEHPLQICLQLLWLAYFAHILVLWCDPTNLHRDTVSTSLQRKLCTDMSECALCNEQMSSTPADALPVRTLANSCSRYSIAFDICLRFMQCFLYERDGVHGMFNMSKLPNSLACCWGIKPIDWKRNLAVLFLCTTLVGQCWNWKHKSKMPWTYSCWL